MSSLTGSACFVALLQLLSVQVAPGITALLAIMMPWLKKTLSQTLALVVPIALLESHPTQQLRLNQHPVSPWVAVFAGQIIWN